MNLTKPYFKSTRSVCQRDDLYEFDVYKPAYLNSECSRCEAPKKVASETLWCDACNQLPICDVCGDTSVDCTCDEFEEECRGCEFGCGLCVPSMRTPGHYFDRERWGYDG